MFIRYEFLSERMGRICGDYRKLRILKSLGIIPVYLRQSEARTVIGDMIHTDV